MIFIYFHIYCYFCIDSSFVFFFFFNKLFTWLQFYNRQCHLFYNFHAILYLSTVVCFICHWTWPWSYGSWIYNYLCNPWLSPLMLWVRISIRAKCTTLCDKICQWLATGRWFSPGPPVSNKTDRHDITEMLLKVALSTIKKQRQQTYMSLRR
jgi:hypothetical protein